MSVRAKFRVTAIERTLGSQNTGRKTAEGSQIYEAVEMQTIKMQPVYGNGDPEHENTKFWQASPSGELKLGTVNAEAARYFQLNREYYLDFTAAENQDAPVL